MNFTATPLLSERFETALVYAVNLHRQQLRKGTNIPYLSHLLAVTALVLEDGGDEDTAIAALLHDAIEDAGGEKVRQEIQQKFGMRVAQIVEGCTDTDEIPKPPWKERKERYIAKFSQESAEVRRVSLADKLHNARSTLSEYQRIGTAIWDIFRGGRQGTLWYYQSLIQAAKDVGETSMLLIELERIIQQLEDCP
jgi:(p)ppGpp synthase/HD superfamily hydrolase